MSSCAPIVIGAEILDMGIDMKLNRKFLMTTAALTCLSVAVAACGGKNDGEAGSAAGAKLEKAAAKLDPAPNADEAVRALALHESGAGALSFASKETKGALTIFNNVTINGPESQNITAEKVTLVNPGMEEGEPKFQSLQFEKLTIPQDGGDGLARIGMMTIKNPNASMMQVVESLLNGEEAEDFNAKDLSEWQFEELSLSDLEVNPEEGGLISLGKVKFHGLKEGILDGFKLSGLSADIPDDNGKVAIQLDEVDFSNLFLRQVLNEAYLDAVGNPEEFEDLAFSEQMVPTREQMAAQKGHIKGLNVEASGVGIKMNHMAFDADSKGDVVTQKYSVKGVEVKPNGNGSAGAQLGGVLGGLGYDALRMELVGNQVVNFADDTMKGNSKLKIDDALTLDADVAMGGFTKLYGLEKGKKLSQQELISNMEFDSIALKLADSGALDRGFRFAEKMGQGTREENTQKLAGILAIASVCAQNDQQRSLLSSFANAVQNFLSNGGTFSLSIDAKEPIKLSEFMESGDPDKLMKKYGDKPLDYFDIEIKSQ